jgi:phenylalanyl-tRNA synthetase alpha chain
MIGVSDKLGWAFGIGLDRLAMVLFGVPDIRLFWSQDERFLNQFQPGTVSKFKAFSKYPSSYRDISFWINAEAPGAEASLNFHENDLMEILREEGGDIVESARLVSNFTNATNYAVGYIQAPKDRKNESNISSALSINGKV